MLMRLAARAQTRPWICSRCLHQRQSHRPRRFNGTFAAAATAREPVPPPPASSLYGLSTGRAKDDDDTLRNIFDNARFWEDFSRASTKQPPTGIVGNRYLTHPDGFLEFVSTTLSRCNAVVEKVSRAHTVQHYRSMVRELDRLSDLLCRVIDLADFVRGTHPDRRVQNAASKAYTIMFQYMNQLNTTTVLNDQLKKASAIPEVWDSWSEQERVVAKILIEDFSRSAIELPEGARQRFVELSGEIAHVGTEFVERMAPEASYLRFDSKRMRGLEPNMVRALTKWGETKIGTMHHEAQMALRYVDDADVRRDIYMAVRTANKPSITRLEKMLKDRAELAKLSGYETFAHMTLENKMAKSPEAVNQFLGALVEDNKRLVNEELQELMELKRGDAKVDNFPDRINAWDKFYYTHKLLSSMDTKLRTPDFLSSYFSVGTVMQGLSRLFDRLYGIRLVPRETQPGEVWDDGVRRLDVVSDRDGHVAVLYCDLFSREGKTPNPAHFTLRCSREILQSEIEDMSQMSHPFSSPVEAATDGMAVSYNKETDSYFQLPTIALICDFSKHQYPRPTLLNFNDVRTLFHEMGHALHSFLGRTPLQNVSGTRCATDFAELPSVLMEHFASCPDVLALYARHWDTDVPLPMSALEKRLAIDVRTQPAETEAQILLAMLDQAYHSALPLSSSFDSTKVYHDIYNTHASIPEPAGTAWQGFFGHLFGYGATYYSYLFDRAIAGKIWSDVFQKDGKGGSVERVNGEKYKNEVLRWGGGRDGWKCVAGVLGDARLAEGGKEAMKEVGRWGVRESW
ncbi:mitochondrial intermediate peptidase-like protein mitochondrial precursor [Trematosphaeria pertusa]|uniref:Mitochondrial intermediate peptidase n=1 Tax=Trematosphaeria pertusa TaxID=390896 RepID=A0A6A6IQF9_9PLEO|nr:mitochondrial intermediate peptidase-like protein mitochondrial precursor [Trematosphaeria pertusa]KAF2252711.1 mitochondrial intermediate peptidase-like protein mitochondrial precursor [Trematosphaeria pertusa]